MERDLRQKRQLLDAQRDKMKMLAQQAADDQAKAVSFDSIHGLCIGECVYNIMSPTQQEVECEMQSLKEATVKSRHQVCGLLTFARISVHVSEWPTYRTLLATIVSYAHVFLNA